MPEEVATTVRRLTPADATVYQDLRLRALRENPEAFAADYSEEVARTLPEVEARLVAAVDGSRCVFGAFAGDRMVGFVAFLRPSRPKLRHCAELAGMYVAPEARRLGLGGALVDALLGHARAQPGLRQVRLGANATNSPAKGLYESRGFRSIGLHPEALFIEGKYYDEEFYLLRLAGD